MFEIYKIDSDKRRLAKKRKDIVIRAKRLMTSIESDVNLDDVVELIDFCSDNQVSDVAHNNKYIINMYKYFDLDLDGKKKQLLAIKNFEGHKVDSLEYLTVLYGESEALSMATKRSERLSGENNPAYGHGGKLSPFSKKFVKYGGEDKRMEVVQKAADNRISTSEIEYYLNQGMSEEDAKNELYERQAVGSLEQFIERADGDIELGTANWKNRQEKWQNTLNSKSDEEIRDINSRKGADTSFRHKAFNDVNRLAHVYFIKLQCMLSDKIFYKLGATTRIKTKKRFSHYASSNIKILEIITETSRKTVVEISDIEASIHKELRNKIGIINLGRTFDGWTESYDLNDNQVEIIKRRLKKV